MRTYESTGIAATEILLPGEGVAHNTWAVVACDQYTSQPEYWQAVKDLVAGAPSTLNLIYPEVYLGEANAEDRIKSIRETMAAYLAKGVLAPHDGLIYVERHAAGRQREGIVCAVDLEQYDYTKTSTSLIRATEGTIVDRLPPRIKIREGAPLELPHIMVLIDDPEHTVIHPLTEKKDSLQKLYDFDLMQDSGHLAGYLVDPETEKQVVAALERLRDPETFAKKYNLDEKTPVLLFAMGDGNHSLATAKAIWEKTKEQAKDDAVMQRSTRYALVELVNVHDDAMQFEPIHRVLFDIEKGFDLLAKIESHYKGRITRTKVDGLEAMKKKVATSTSSEQQIGVIHKGGYEVLTVVKPDQNLPVGSLQVVLDPIVLEKRVKEIDYVHGTEAVDELGRKPNNIGFFLPAMDKKELFRTVILDGALPRKTFSMGEAEEKRFYMECRQLGE